jgi:TFIIF-interacting CTD phosphatase-like protein
MVFIYKIENINNNKCYIGWTSKSVDFRWNEHKSDAIKIRDNRKFYNAIRKYGVDSWNVTTLCEADSKEIAKIINTSNDIVKKWIHKIW